MSRSLADQFTDAGFPTEFWLGKKSGQWPVHLFTAESHALHFAQDKADPGYARSVVRVDLTEGVVEQLRFVAKTIEDHFDVAVNLSKVEKP